MSEANEERLRVLEGEVEVLKALKGRMEVPAPMLMLLWSILVAIGGGIWLLSALSVEVGTLARDVRGHITLSGHPGSSEAMDALEKRVERLEHTKPAGGGP